MLDDNKLIDAINVLSYLIAVENLHLNEKQVSDLDKHLRQQDSILIEQQNKMLEKIIEQNEEIIKILMQNLCVLKENEKK